MPGQRLDFEEYPGGLDPVESLRLHVMARASERHEEDMLSDGLFMGDTEVAEHLYAAASSIQEGNASIAREYFVDTGLVSEQRLADALDISVEELQVRLQKTS